MNETPFFIACKLGHEKIVADLLEKGADYKSKDAVGRSCKEIAKRNGKDKIAQLISIWDVYKFVPKHFFD